MIRAFFLFILIVAAALGLAWYSAQSLPDWYHDGERQLDLASGIAEQPNMQVAGEFLEKKLADLMRGKLVLDQAEFNALLNVSLRSSADGRNLLRVSDGVHAELENGRIEFGVILNLDKLARHNAELRELADNALEAFPLLDKSRVALAVNGRPIARNGDLALAPDLILKIGSIPIPSNFLQGIGIIDFENVRASLPLNYMSIRDVAITDSEITLRGVPRW